MKIVGFLLHLALFPAVVSALQSSGGKASRRTVAEQAVTVSTSDSAVDRKGFVATVTATATATAATVALFGTGSVVAGVPLPASARGRATLEQSYDRYVPRIVAGGEFFKNDLRSSVEKSDWTGVKNALAEPPKKSRADRAKPDGGSSDRASQAGGFSDARVLVACDLFAAAFSDSSISGKTKKMKSHVEEMRSAVVGMQQTARQALGEESAGGGLFGIGAKKPSQNELAKRMRDLYVQAGNSYNRYVFEANAELPLEFKKLPYL